MSSSSVALAQHKDYTGSKMAIWLFLITEVLLFGGMFLLYSIYRSEYSGDFHHAAAELDVMVGTVNTVVLLTSSLTMAMSIAAVHRGNRTLALILLAITVICGGVFMVNKYFEWGAKIAHGIYPGSEYLLAHPKGQVIFFGLYFAMTGLHGAHIVVGMVLLTVMFFKVLNQPNSQVSFVAGHGLQDAQGCHLAIVDKDGEAVWKGEEIDDSVERMVVKTKYWPVRKRFRVQDFNQLENSGLYWHLVDLIWIFLFPLFYLIT
jgi:cytochrome c oxidase subunit 3